MNYLNAFRLALALSPAALSAQQGYDIKVNLKGCNDSMVYLVKYRFDQQYIEDTCMNVKNGQIRFKGKRDLDRGMYVLVSEAKATYFDFFINESQKFSMSADMADLANSLKAPGNKENEQFFSYVKFMSAKNVELGKIREAARGKSKADSAKWMNEQIAALNNDVKAYDKSFMERNKGSLVYDFMNLKTEKEPVEIPKASNGRPDSVYQYYYYKNHFLDGIDFKDERILHTPIFDDRIKRYLEQVIVQHPDTVISEEDKILAQCVPGSLVYNILLGYFTYTAEQSKIMGFDKVFVHLADTYVISGKAKGVYSEESVQKIRERTDIMRNLLLGAKVSDLYMIDSVYGRQVMRMGFDTAKTSKGVTDLYYKNLDKLTPMFRRLYDVKAKYTVLVFWAADCGHCKTEIPKLRKNLEELQGRADVKVYAVQTKDELFDSWKTFMIENKLNSWINVIDPIHLNNLKDKFDIYSTPVIYILDEEKKIKAKRLDADQVLGMIKALERV